MSREVDKKVVEMEFDNARFEKNINQSMNSINNLKQSLDFSGNYGSISAIADNVQSLANRFSTLGIVGMRVIEKLTDGMIRLASKTISFATDGIVSGGIKRATNLENAHFQLQGLLRDEQAVSDVMVNVNDAVDGTAYSLDAAAKVASQLAASGMRAGDGMFKSLRAVAGVAAMTNSSYEDIGDIFTNINGQGRVMSNDLNRLAARGLNAAAILGEQMGKTESEIRDMVTKGKIDFNTFAMAMDDAFGEHAKAANTTFSGAMSNVKAALARIGALFVSPLISQNGPAVQFLNAIRARINDIKTLIVPIADVVTGKINEFLSRWAGKVEKFKIDAKPFEKITDIVTRFGTQLSFLMHNTQKIFSNVFAGIGSIIKPIASAFKEVFPEQLGVTINKIARSIANLTSHFKLSEKASKSLHDTFVGIFSVLRSFADVVAWIGKSIMSILPEFDGLGEKILNFTAGLGDCIKSFRDFIADLPIVENLGNAVVSVFRGIAKAVTKIGEFGGSIFKGIGEGLASIFQNGNAAFALNSTLFAALAYNVKNVFVQIRKIICLFNPIEKGINPLGLFTDTLDRVRDTLFQWEKDLNANYFLKIGGAILMLATGLFILSGIPGERLASSLGALTIAMGELVGAMYLLSNIEFSRKNIRASKMILKLSEAMLIMAAALKILSGIDPKAMGAALLGMALGLGEMVGALALLAKIKHANKAAKQLIKLSEALLIMSVALKIMSSVSHMGTALAGMAGVLAELLIFTKLIGKSKIKGAGQILVLSTALVILGGALKIFGSMSLGQLGLGLGTIAASLLIFAGAMALMKQGMTGATAMIIMATAINILIPPLVILGHMSLKQIGKSLLTLAGVFVVFGVAGLVLAPLAPVLITIAAAIGLLGIGIGAAAAGLALLAGAFISLSAAGIAAEAAITTIVMAFINLIPAIAIALADGLVAFISALAENASTLIDSVTTLVSAVITSITTLVPQFIELGKTFILSFLEAAKECIPELIDTGKTIIISFCEGISETIPKVAELAIVTVTKFLNAISKRLPDLFDAGWDLIISFIDGLADSIDKHKDEFSDAVWHLFTSVLALAVSVITGWFPRFKKLGSDLIHSNFVQGIVSKVVEIKDTIVTGIKNAVKAVGEFVTDFWNAGVNIVEGLIGGIKSMAKGVAESAKGIAKGAWEAAKNFLDINSPSKKFIVLGKSCDEGLIVGAERMANKVDRSFVGVAKGALKAMGDSLASVPVLLQNDIDLTPSITPIMDLSNVRSGAKSISSMLDGMRSFNIAADVSANNKRGSTNSDIVDAVNRLNKKLDHVGGTTNYTTIDGVHYNEGTEVADAVAAIVRAARIEGRV